MLNNHPRLLLILFWKFHWELCQTLGGECNQAISENIPPVMAYFLLIYKSSFGGCEIVLKDHVWRYG